MKFFSILVAWVELLYAEVDLNAHLHLLLISAPTVCIDFHMLSQKLSQHYHANNRNLSQFIYTHMLLSYLCKCRQEKTCHRATPTG